MQAETRKWQLMCVVAGAMALWVCSAAHGADGMWKVGTAKVNITPEKPIWMAGYGSRDRPADGKTADLWAKALVMEDQEGRRAVLVTLDLLGIDRTLSTTVCARLEQKFGLRRDQVALCASHTHSGPVVGSNLGAVHFEQVTAEHQALITAYAGKLEENISGVVGMALETMKPAHLSWGSGRATFAVNRRTNREGKVPQLRAAGQLKGPVDHDVPVLAVRDVEGILRAVVFGYACHATTVGLYQWNADYPGYATTELEELHPGITALFWAGCGADQNPLPRGKVELSQEYGRKLAGAVETVLAGVMLPVTPHLGTRYRELDLPFASLPSVEEIRKEAKSGDPTYAARARMFLRQIDAGRPLSPIYPYPVAQWLLGDEIQWVFLGGEVVVDYAVRIKAEQRGVRTWVTGFANDVMTYIPSLRVLKEGGYEGGGASLGYGQPGAWAPEVESLIIGAVEDTPKK